MYDTDRNFGCRISDQWTLKGLRAVVMENEFLRLTVLTDKGSDIYEFLYKPLDLDFMWRSPMGLRNPAAGRTTRETAGGPFLDYYEGGWQEILPSGGSASTHQGVEYGQHGELANVPWSVRIEHDDPDEVSCRLTVRTMRTPLMVDKLLTIKKGEAKLYIEETLTNLAPEPIDIMWGHHLAFGEPFLDEHCRLDTTARKILIHPEAYSQQHRFAAGETFDWPIATTKSGEPVDFHQIPPRSIQTEDMTYLLDLEQPWFALTHTTRKVGFGLRWDSQVFPHLWYWQVLGGGRGYPWYGRTYNIGLEPWCGYPSSGLAAAVKEGTARTLTPHEEVHSRLVATVYTGLTKVNGISDEGDVT